MNHHGSRTVWDTHKFKLGGFLCLFVSFFVWLFGDLGKNNPSPGQCTDLNVVNSLGCHILLAPSLPLSSFTHPHTTGLMLLLGFVGTKVPLHETVGFLEKLWRKIDGSDNWLLSQFLVSLFLEDCISLHGHKRRNTHKRIVPPKVENWIWQVCRRGQWPCHHSVWLQHPAFRHH